MTIGFESGVPVSVNGERLAAFPLLSLLNKIGGRNGIGRIDMIENRFVGMKSRGVYEAAGMTISFIRLHRLVEEFDDGYPDLMYLR